MEDDTLKHISMITVIIGLIVLLIILRYKPLPVYNTFLTDKENYVGKEVILYGTVERVTERNGTISLTVSRRDTVTLNLPPRVDMPTVGEDVRIEGSVEKYKGKIFIRPEKVIRENVTVRP